MCMYLSMCVCMYVGICTLICMYICIPDEIISAYLRVQLEKSAFFPEKICLFPGYFRTFFVLILKKNVRKLPAKKPETFTRKNEIFNVYSLDNNVNRGNGYYLLRIGVCWLKGTLLSYA